MVKKFTKLDYSHIDNNRINIAFNLTFFSVYSTYNKFLTNQSVSYWVDGKFGLYFLKFIGINSTHIRGPDLLRIIFNHCIENNISITIIGNLNYQNELYLKSINVKFNYIKLLKIDINDNNQFDFKKTDSICLITLPSPKQEYIASYLNNCTVYCIGGALNIVCGLERESPIFISKYGLEWAWRLMQNDSKRRLNRLIKSMYSFFKNISHVKRLLK